MKILAAAGSFKDVYTSLEACEMIKNILGAQHEVITAPICDGGEYTYDILNSYFTCKKEYAKDVCNPYGKQVRVPYLVLSEEAYVISSEIIRLMPEEEAYKNPLLLTDYGLGQVLLDAVQKGYRRINLCLGGTSTIGFGIGTAQALGVRFYDETGALFTEPLKPVQYSQISRMEYDREHFSGIHLKVINDGITKACDLATVNPLKIGKQFAGDKQEILQKIDEAFAAVLRVTGLTAKDPYSGNGGGIYFGIEHLFDTEYVKGTEYFCRLFHLKEAIESCELVITGEGRFDNPHLKKIPIVVTELAKNCHKRVLFICGQADEELLSHTDLAAIGIDTLISCGSYYRTHKIEKTYENDAMMYREMTPVILREELEKLWKTNYSV